MKIAIVAILALLFLPLASAAVQQASPPENGSVEGVILDAITGEPVQGAEVVAFAWPSPRTVNQVPRARTAADGRFTLALAAGSYRIASAANGYAAQEHGTTLAGRAGLDTGTVFVLDAGGTVAGITIRLMPTGIITGRIISTDGAPLAGIEVSALQPSYDATGWRTLQGERTAQTDSQGMYRLTGVPPGAHYVRAGLTPLADARSLDPRGFSNADKYAAVYYPDASAPEAASRVEVSAGMEVAGVDIALPRQSTYRIRGRIVDPGNMLFSPRNVTMWITRMQSGFLSSLYSSVRPYDQNTGVFELVDVAPGWYWVSASLPDPPVPPEIRVLLETPGAEIPLIPRGPRALAAIEVTAADVDNVLLVLVPSLSLSGRLLLESGEAAVDIPGLENIRIELTPIIYGDTQLGIPVRAEPVDAEGNFTVAGEPSDYRVRVSALPPNFYLKEARLGAIDALQQPVRVIGPLFDSLDIVLGTNGGQLRGAVTDAAAAPAAGVTAVLIPDGRRPDLYKTAITAADGQFAFENIPPGNYRVLAWENMPGYSFFDPDFVQRFEGMGVAVQVEQGADLTIEVRVIPAGG